MATGRIAGIHKYIISKIKTGKEIRLNFIFSRNSRRSQLSQIWAETVADYFGIKTTCYSGGVVVTAFNEPEVAAIRWYGFKMHQIGEGNQIYFVFHGEDAESIITFSKIHDDEINAQKDFAAVMTSDHADEHCPFIPGAETRIPL